MDRKQKINSILGQLKGGPLRGSMPISWWIKHPQKVAEKLKLVVIQNGNDYFVEDEKVDIERVREISDSMVILPDNGR